MEDIEKIKNVIAGFSKAGDGHDADTLATYLDDNFRIVMNRLFGSEKVSVMHRSVYLEKVRTKEFGGDTRVLDIENVIVNGPSAFVKVSFNGKRSAFVSLITLIKDKNGNWLLVGEVPVMQ